MLAPQELYPLQRICVESTIAAVDKGKRAPLILGPTGFGKTRVGVELLVRTHAKGNRGLWIAPRLALINQTVDSLHRNGVERLSVLRGDDDRVDPEAQIVVCTVQTLQSRGDRPEARVVIFDEARHYLSAEWQTVSQHYTGSIRVGLDATPQRADGTAMGNMYDVLIVGAQPRQLIALGLLVPCRVIVPVGGQSKAMAEHPVVAYQTLAPGRRAVVFEGSVKDARDRMHEFNAVGIPCGCIDGRMGGDDRERTLAAFERGDLQVVCSVHCLSEGWDCPPCDCAILARGFSVESTMIQAVGRIVRPYPGKVDALVIDLHGCCLSLGLPDQDREYSLEGRGISACNGTIAITQCPMCGRVFPADVWKGGTCPGCGWQRPAKVNPAIRRQNLEELRAERVVTHVGQMKVDFLREQLIWCRTTMTRAGQPHKPGFALQRFLAKWHHYPDRITRERAGWPTGFVREKETGT